MPSWKTAKSSSGATILSWRSSRGEAPIPQSLFWHREASYPIFHAASFLPSCAEYRLTVSLPFTYRSYEDYLDSQISEIDLYYLDDVQACRQLVELGHRGNGEIVKRAEFNARKEASEIAKQQRANKKPKKLASAGKDLDAFPLLKVRCRPFALACLPAVSRLSQSSNPLSLLSASCTFPLCDLRLLINTQALAQREEAVRNGKLTTIIFLRDLNAKKQEVSGYIDYAHRLKTENWDPVFDRTKRLLPKATDLSFFNWDTQNATCNATPNFQVIGDNEAGLMFKNKRDRKVIDVDPHKRPGDNTTRTDITTDEYLQVCIWDHVSRRRT